MSTTSRERDRNALRDLAKLANMTPPPVERGVLGAGVQHGARGSRDEGGLGGHQPRGPRRRGGRGAGVVEGSGGPQRRRRMPTLRSATEPPRAPDAQPSAARVPAARAAQAEPVGDHRRHGRRSSRSGGGLLRPPEGRSAGRRRPRWQRCPSRPPRRRRRPLLPLSRPRWRPSRRPTAGWTRPLSRPQAWGPRSGPAWRFPLRRSRPEPPARRPPPRRSLSWLPPPRATPAPRAARRTCQSLMQQAAGVTSTPTSPTATAGTPDLPAPGSVPLRPTPRGPSRGARGRPPLRAELPRARRPHLAGDHHVRLGRQRPERLDLRRCRGQAGGGLHPLGPVPGARPPLRPAHLHGVDDRPSELTKRRRPITLRAPLLPRSRDGLQHAAGTTASVSARRRRAASATSATRVVSARPRSPSTSRGTTPRPPTRRRRSSAPALSPPRRHGGASRWRRAPRPGAARAGSAGGARRRARRS